MATGNQTVLDLGCVDVTRSPIALHQVIADNLVEKLERAPTAKEVDDEIQLALFERTKEVRASAFRVEVAHSPVPFEESLLRISQNSGETWVVIRLLPEEKALVAAALA